MKITALDSKAAYRRVSPKENNPNKSSSKSSTSKSNPDELKLPKIKKYQTWTQYLQDFENARVAEANDPRLFKTMEALMKKDSKEAEGELLQMMATFPCLSGLVTVPPAEDEEGGDVGILMHGALQIGPQYHMAISYEMDPKVIEVGPHLFRFGNAEEVSIPTVEDLLSLESKEDIDELEVTEEKVRFRKMMIIPPCLLSAFSSHNEDDFEGFLVSSAQILHNWIDSLDEEEDAEKIEGFKALASHVLGYLYACATGITSKENKIPIQQVNEEWFNPQKLSFSAYTEFTRRQDGIIEEKLPVLAGGSR